MRSSPASEPAGDRRRELAIRVIWTLIAKGAALVILWWLFFREGSG